MYYIKAKTRRLFIQSKMYLLVLLLLVGYATSNCPNGGILIDFNSNNIIYICYKNNLIPLSYENYVNNLIVISFQASNEFKKEAVATVSCVKHSSFRSDLPSLQCNCIGIEKKISNCKCSKVTNNFIIIATCDKWVYYGNKPKPSVSSTPETKNQKDEYSLISMILICVIIAILIVTIFVFVMYLFLKKKNKKGEELFNIVE